VRGENVVKICRPIAEARARAVITKRARKHVTGVQREMVAHALPVRDIQAIVATPSDRLLHSDLPEQWESRGTQGSIGVARPAGRSYAWIDNDGLRFVQAQHVNVLRFDG